MKTSVRICFFATLAGLAACQAILGIGDRVAAEEAGEDAARVPEEASPTDAALAPPKPEGCGLGLTACGAGCVDVRRDPRHCGECGRDCLDAACSAGSCEVAVVVPGNHGGAVYVDDGELFYRADDDHTTVSTLVARRLTTGDERTLTEVGPYFSMAKAGPRTWLVEDQIAGSQRVRLLDVANAAVVREILRVPLSVPGGRDNTSIGQMKVVGTTVYFSTLSSVGRVELDGTRLEIVSYVGTSDAGTGASGFTVENDRIVFSLGDVASLVAQPMDLKLDRVELDRSRGGGSPWVTSTPGGVRWLTKEGLREVPADGGAPFAYPFFVDHTAHTATDDGVHLYVADMLGSDADGAPTSVSRILRHHLGTHRHLVLATGLPSMGQIAVDDRYVYIPAYGGPILRVAK